MFTKFEKLIKGFAFNRQSLALIAATTFFGFTLVGCADDNLPDDPNKGNGTENTIQTTDDESLTNLDGILVLSEGNLSDENGTLSFINMAKAGYPATNWIYRAKNNDATLGNVVQSLFVDGEKLYILSQNGDRNDGAKHVVVTDKNFVKIKFFNPGEGFASSYGSGITPKRIAILGNTAYVNTSSSFLYSFDVNDETTAPAKVENIGKLTDAEMLVVKESGKKVLYAAGSKNDGCIYRIDDQKNITKIDLDGAAIENIIPVQRKNGAEGYIWAVGYKGDKKSGVLYKIANGKVAATFTFTPEYPVGNNRGACHYQGDKDIVYFTVKNGEWSSYTIIYKFEEASGNFTKIFDNKEIPGVLTKHISYNHIAVSQKTGEVFFPIIEDYTTYLRNAVVVIDNTGKIVRWYASKPLTKYNDDEAKYTLDTRFAAGLYAIADFAR